MKKIFMVAELVVSFLLVFVDGHNSSGLHSVLFGKDNIVIIFNKDKLKFQPLL